MFSSEHIAKSKSGNRPAPAKAAACVTDNRPSVVVQRKQLADMNSRPLQFKTNAKSLARIVQEPIQNIAVPAHDVLQCVFDTSGVTGILSRRDMGDKKNQQARELEALAASYNETHEPGNNTQEALHGQQKKLHDLERKAHEILADPHLSLAARQQVFNLLNEMQQQHTALTTRTLAANAPLWLPEGMSKSDNEQAQQLWKSLTGQNKSKGNIRLETKSDEFRNKTFAAYAQLLRGKTGRALLHDLNKTGKKKNKRGQNKHVYITDDAAANFTQPGIKLDPHGSYAEPYSRAHGVAEDHFTEKPGKVANKGTGAYVQIDKNEEPASFDDRLMGESGEALYTPMFVTLGHELGHAQAHLHGRTQSLFRDNTTYESTIWSNAEEKRNIEHVENNLRNEHGIAKRKYHYTKGAARHERYKKEFDTELQSIWNDIVLPSGLAPRVNAEVVNFGQLALAIDNNTDFKIEKNVKKMRARLAKVRVDVQAFVQHPPPAPAPPPPPAPPPAAPQPGFVSRIWGRIFG